MPPFQLGRSVAENVANLRVALGSATRRLSREDLGKLVTARHPDRTLGDSAVERWEKGVEPDYHSLRIMADLAGVTLEQFAFGDPAALPEPDEAADLAAFERLQALAAEREATERSSSRRAAGGHPTRSGRRGKGK